MLPRNVAVVRFEGDYNFWFLPQQEDRMNVSPGGNPGPSAYFVKYRPVFEAAPPGRPVSPDLAGATTDGPSDPANFSGLGTVAGMRSCSAGHFGPYDTKTAAYQDNVASWPSVEPADDYTANSLLAFALGAQQGMTGSGLG